MFKRISPNHIIAPPTSKMSGQGKIVTNQVPVPFIGDEVATTMVPPSRPIIPHNEPSMADLAAMSPQQLTLYLTTLIVREWKKSATCLYPSRNKVVANLMLSDKEVAVCHVKFRCEDVPRDVVAKVRHLAKLGVGEGEGCFDKFMALLKKEVRLVTFEDDVNSPKIDRYKGVSGAVEMVSISVISLSPVLLAIFLPNSYRLLAIMSFLDVTSAGSFICTSRWSSHTKLVLHSSSPSSPSTASRWTLTTILTQTYPTRSSSRPPSSTVAASPTPIPFPCCSTPGSLPS